MFARGLLVLCLAGALEAQVSFDRILHADREPQNWLTYSGSVLSHRYSPLTQINAGNVANLKPLWTLSTGVEEAHQAPPIVNDGVMFLSTPRNQVIAVDARTGEIRWRYRRELPDDLFQVIRDQQRADSIRRAETRDEVGVLDVGEGVCRRDGGDEPRSCERHDDE